MYRWCYDVDMAGEFPESDHRPDLPIELVERIGNTVQGLELVPYKRPKAVLPENVVDYIPPAPQDETAIIPEFVEAAVPKRERQPLPMPVIKPRQRRPGVTHARPSRHQVGRRQRP